MEVLAVDRVREALESTIQRTQGETLEVRRDTPESNITGLVVRTDFRGLPAVERQRRLTDLFDREFGELANQISLILTFTPEEYEAWDEDRQAAS